MANVLLTSQVLTRMALMNLGGYLAVCRNMTKQYSKEFAKPGAKAGDTISVRKPQRYVTTKGLNYQPQAITNIKTTITVNEVTGVHFEWDGVERELDLDDIQRNYGKPAGIAIAHAINAEMAQLVAQNTFNAVGTPGTTPSTLATFLGAGDLIVAMGLPPQEDLACIVNRKISSAFVSAQSTLFNPAGDISADYKKGEVSGNPLGYNWVRDQTIYVQTSGVFGGTPLIKGANQTTDSGNNDTMTLLTDAWTASTGAVAQGDRFTIAGVYSVHPQTRQSTGYLQQFVVLAPATADGSTNMSILVAPGITPSGQYQNVTAAAADDAAITMFGAASTASPQALLLHENAHAFVSLPLDVPKSGEGVEKSELETDDETGIVLSFVRFFDGTKFVHGNRFDCLTGYGPLYREMGCVIAA